MIRRHALVSTALLCVAAGLVHLSVRSCPNTVERSTETPAQASSDSTDRKTAETRVTSLKEQEPPPPPPPPPSGLGRERGTPSPTEPRRLLLGVTRDELREVERYLPTGAQIYAYAVGDEYLAGAIISADLDGDGNDETVVIYNERKPTPKEGSLPLTLSILMRTENKLRVRASVALVGAVLFTQHMKGLDGPFSVLDLIGKGTRQIVVVSGGGASVGGALQVFSYNGSELQRLAQIGGHFFSVRTQGRGRPSVLEARWKEENQVRSYRWDGHEFVEIARRALKRR